MFNRDKTKVGLFKRSIAFAMDYLLVALICTVLATVLPINTDYSNILLEQADLITKYQEYIIDEDNIDTIIENLNKEIKEYDESEDKEENLLLDDYSEVKELLVVEEGKELDKETFKTKFTDLTYDKYLEKYNELSYSNLKSSVGVTFLTIIVTLIYFPLCYVLMDGQTLAKRVLKIRVVSTNNKKVSWFRYFIRTGLIARSFGDLIIYTLVLVLSKEVFMNYYSTISDIVTITWLAVIGCSMWRLDNRGLHDLITSTRVCKVGYENVDNVNNDVKEATFEEKQEVKETDVVVNIEKEVKKEKVNKTKKVKNDDTTKAKRKPRTLKVEVEDNKKKTEKKEEK